MKFLFIFTLLFSLSVDVFAATVKRSSTGICHDSNSPFYSRVSEKDTYSTIEACLAIPNSRLPKISEQSSVSQLPGKKLYNRDDWKHWSDFDNNCINSRHQTLIDQAKSNTIKLSANGCYVNSGVWYDAYSGKLFYSPKELQIDHIVPLAWASRSGGADWSPALKEQFANDPINLIAVSSSLNQSKGAKPPSEWMPPNHAFRCQYLVLWDNVFSKYPSLKMTASEARVFNRMKGACGL